MAKKMPEKTEAEILYPSMRVGEYDIEPWGMWEIAKIMPYVYAARDKLAAANVKIDSNILLDVPRYLPLVIDEVMEVVAITLGVTTEQVKAVKPRSLTIEIVLTILSQNIGYLKNSLGLLGLVTKSISA